MPLEDFDSHGAPQKVLRTVLVVDVVESVRLIEENEDDVIRRWRQLVDQVAREVLPAHGGRLVKSLDRKSTRLNSSHVTTTRMPSSA